MAINTSHRPKAVGPPPPGEDESSSLGQDRPRSPKVGRGAGANEKKRQNQSQLRKESQEVNRSPPTPTPTPTPLHQISTNIHYVEDTLDDLVPSAVVKDLEDIIIHRQEENQNGLKEDGLILLDQGNGISQGYE
eukprot:356274_1